MIRRPRAIQAPALLLLAVALGLAAPAAAMAQATTPAREKVKTKAKAKVKVKEAAPAGKVDLNKATAEELETLPGIGPAFSREIIAARPFASVDDLERVKGLSKARVDALRDRVTVAPPPVVAPTPKPAAEPTPRAKAAATEPASKAKAKTKGAAKAATAAPKPVATPNAVRPVNLNTASKEELDALPGIGPVKAQAILDYRKAQPFKTREDVMKVKGIKEGEFSRIRDLIVAP